MSKIDPPKVNYGLFWVAMTVCFKALRDIIVFADGVVDHSVAFDSKFARVFIINSCLPTFC